MKKLRVVVVERAGVDAGVGGGERSAVVGEARALAQALLAVGEGVGPDGVDLALFLDVVEHLVDALVDPGEAAHLDADEVLAASLAATRGPRAALGLWPELRAEALELGLRAARTARRRRRSRRRGGGSCGGRAESSWGGLLCGDGGETLAERREFRARTFVPEWRVRARGGAASQAAPALTRDWAEDSLINR